VPPYLQIYRGDLHTALLSAVPSDSLFLDKRLEIAEETPSGVMLRFADGTTTEADVVIGADGLHSRFRTVLLGPTEPVATGRVAYGATFPAGMLPGPIGPCTKWCGEDRHIVIYYVTKSKDEVYFVTSLPDTEWVNESWSATGEMDVVRDAFSGFHAEVLEVLRACPKVHRWAILDRAPMDQWHGAGMILIGDAAHPMTPYMAQGAAIAMEDGVMLARAIANGGDLGSARLKFETARKAGTSEVQAVSHANTWMPAIPWMTGGLGVLFGFVMLAGGLALNSYSQAEAQRAVEGASAAGIFKERIFIRKLEQLADEIATPLIVDNITTLLRM
jgi:6-hydroxynicotinate 3-monooxygenase